MKNILIVLFVLLSFSTCSKSDCADKVCLNGGECIDGTCECNEIWTGSDCSEQLIPRFAVVTNVRVLNYPELNMLGNPWDDNDDPDITFEVFDNSNEIYDYGNFLSNVTPGTVQDFKVDLGDLKMNTRRYYLFHLLDYDFSEGFDKIGEGGLVPLNIDTVNLPDTLFTANGEIAFAIAVEYEW